MVLVGRGDAEQTVGKHRSILEENYYILLNRFLKKYHFFCEESSFFTGCCGNSTDFIVKEVCKTCGLRQD